MTTRVKLNKVRLAFADSLLGPAEDFQGNKVFRHSATFLIVPKSDNAKAIEAAIVAEAKTLWPKKYEAMLESMRGNSNKYCYQKGDLKDYDGFEGMMYINGHKKAKEGRPLLLDSIADPETGKPARLTDKEGRFFDGKEGRLYAGCYVNASIEIYAQDGQNPGIRCGLLGVQFAEHGDSFGGGGRASEDDFDAIEAPAEESDDLA